MKNLLATTVLVAALCSGTQARCSGPPQITTTSTSTTVRSTSTTLVTQTASLLPEHCTTRPTSTLYSTSGCAITCPTTFNCIADMGLIIPCGCTSVAVRPVTKYVCPSNTACWQCQTGWGLHKETETGCETKTATATARPTP